MPRLVKAMLTERLHRSGLFDRLATDVRILFRKRLWFIADGAPVPGDSIKVELIVGAVTVGWMGFKPSAQPARNKAYKRWLEMAARIFAEDLSAPQEHSAHEIPAKIAVAARYIQTHHREPLTLADVAAAVGLSRERLSRLFHESLGVSFSQYLNQARLSTARALLAKSELSITEIAYESGYQSLSQFNRRFKESEELSPGAYRKRRVALQTQPRAAN